MDIFIYINVFIFGWISCQIYLSWKLRQALKKVAEDNGLTLEEMAEQYFSMKGVRTIQVPNYFTELSGNSILLYNKDTGDFVSQASSLEQLAENVYTFNKIKFATVKHIDDELWFVDGKIEKDLHNI